MAGLKLPTNPPRPPTDPQYPQLIPQLMEFAKDNPLPSDLRSDGRRFHEKEIGAPLIHWLC